MPILTERKERFAQHYAAHRDPKAAYRASYNVRHDTAEGSVQAQASRLLADVQIAARIEEITAAALGTLPAVFDVATALGKWLEIVTANPDELIGLRVGCCRHCWGEAHGYQWREREYLAELDKATKIQAKDPAYPYPDPAGGFGFRMAKAPNPECPECEGEGVERVVARDTSKLSPGALALFGGVKKTSRGLEIIIADRTKALENATRMIGGFNDKVQLNGSLSAMLAVARLETVDPQEASRAYMKLMAANAA